MVNEPTVWEALQNEAWPPIELAYPERVETCVELRPTTATVDELIAALQKFVREENGGAWQWSGWDDGSITLVSPDHKREVSVFKP
jgi:hypothetical protein